jgi:radical SAM-linked protein
MITQRFRVRFRKGDRVRYISHLDVLRAWERSIRRAELPLSYSQGFTPHPRLAFASPLPLGFTSEAEIMDVSLDERVELCDFQSRLAAETTDDLAVLAVEEVPVTAPAPQAAMLWADYAADIPGLPLAEAEAAIASFLALETLPWTEERKEKASRTYDLRRAVATLAAEPAGSGVRINMRLQADADVTARPEQLLAAILPSAEPAAYARTGLVLDQSSPAREAWRRLGQFQ